VPGAIAIRSEKGRGDNKFGRKGKERADLSSQLEELEGGRAQGQKAESRGDVALVAALQLATGSRLLHEKRIGRRLIVLGGLRTLRRALVLKVMM
jgi:hypothetical protein